MPIEVVISKSGRCRDVLPLPISQSDHPPSQDPATNSSHEMDDADARDEGGRVAISSTVGSDFIVYPSSEGPPPPNVEQMMDSEDRLAPPLQKPALSQTNSPRIDCADLHMDLRALRGQNDLITNISDRLQDQNSKLYSQAEAFQTLHDRHEHSINAILVFLATFYNRVEKG
jgi:hypothetical protein